MLTTLITIGVDFIVIMLTEIALPLLFAAIDGLMCLLDYFKPSGWNDQLECEPKFEPCTLSTTHYTLHTSSSTASTKTQCCSTLQCGPVDLSRGFDSGVCPLLQRQALFRWETRIHADKLQIL